MSSGEFGPNKHENFPSTETNTIPRIDKII